METNPTTAAPVSEHTSKASDFFARLVSEAEEETDVGAGPQPIATGIVAHQAPAKQVTYPLAYLLTFKDVRLSPLIVQLRLQCPGGQVWLTRSRSTPALHRQAGAAADGRTRVPRAGPFRGPPQGPPQVPVGADDSAHVEAEPDGEEARTGRAPLASAGEG